MLRRVRRSRTCTHGATWLQRAEPTAAGSGAKVPLQSRVPKCREPRSEFAIFANEHQIFGHSRAFVPHSTFLMLIPRPRLGRAKFE